MRLLITVTVLYLVNSSVYSKFPISGWCEDTAECARGQECMRWGLAMYGKCVTKRKGKGEACEKTADCTQGLECKIPGYKRFGNCFEPKREGEKCDATVECAQGMWCKVPGLSRFGKCSTERKSQYF